MKHPKLIFLGFCAGSLILALAIFSVFNVEADPQGGTFAIPWWSIDNGGGDSSGPTFRVRGTIGQPDAGQLTGPTYGIDGGFWGPFSHTAVASPRYLPIALNNVRFCYEGQQEIEPNNTRAEATGLLCDGRTYQGKPNDIRDYFTFITGNNGNVSVDLTNHAGTGVQLQLFYENGTTPVAFDTVGPTFQVDYNGPAGTYYIYIFTASGYGNTPLYNLVADYP